MKGISKTQAAFLQFTAAEISILNPDTGHQVSAAELAGNMVHHTGVKPHQDQWRGIGEDLYQHYAQVAHAHLPGQKTGRK